MSYTKSGLVSHFKPLLVERGYNPTEILIVWSVADHEFQGDPEENLPPHPCWWSNAKIAWENGLSTKDPRVVQRACNRAEKDGFMIQRPGAGPNGTTMREINVEGFTKYEEELKAIRKRFRDDMEADGPTDDEKSHYDAVAEHLRRAGYVELVRCDDQPLSEFAERIRRTRKYAYKHLRMRLRFVDVDTSNWQSNPNSVMVEWVDAPSAEHLPGFQEWMAAMIADLKSGGYALESGRAELDLRPQYVAGV